MVSAVMDKDLTNLYYFYAEGVSSDSIPRLECRELDSMRPHLLGHGGNGGALVYRVSEALVHKKYPASSAVSLSERSFIACFPPFPNTQCLDLSLARHVLVALCISTVDRAQGTSSGPSVVSTPNRSNGTAPSFSSPLSCPSPNTASSPLPTRLDSRFKKDQGIVAPYIGSNLLMVLKHYRMPSDSGASSLHSSFQRLGVSPPTAAHSSVADDLGSLVGDATGNSIFHQRCAFTPLTRSREELDIIRAVLFQVTSAIAYINTLKHTTIQGEAAQGFYHNDVHLGNILLHRSTGNLVLCDFEHVRSIGSKKIEKWSRAPPLNRQAPNGICSANCDTWSLGLIAVSLLTGITPLFDDNKIIDDFAKGPENPILAAAEYEGDDGVIDWDGVIRPFVVGAIGDSTAHDAADILEFCSRCLQNKFGREGPESASFLLESNQMLMHFRDAPENAARAVRTLISQEHP